MSDTIPSSNDGGRGDLVSPEAHRREQAAHLSVIKQAVHGGWELPPEASRTIPTVLQQIIDDPLTSTRDRIRATECLAALRRDRVDTAVQLDRIMRLDAGTATDRVELLQGVTDKHLAAVAASLKPKREEPPLLPLKPDTKRKARKGKA
jgi:hypothetical protein